MAGGEVVVSLTGGAWHEPPSGSSWPYSTVYSTGYHWNRSFTGFPDFRLHDADVLHFDPIRPPPTRDPVL